MRRLGLALALVLLASPAIAQTTPVEFDCEEQAFDLSTCTDPNDTSTCVALPAPFTRQTPTQRLLRFVTVQTGPFLGAGLTLVAEDAAADVRFAEARDQLCVEDPPLVCPAPGDNGGSSGGSGGGGVGIGVGGGPVWYGPNPGISGPNPGFR